MRISDWSSDVCSSDLHRSPPQQRSASAAGICRFLRRNAPSILSSRKRGGICSFSFSPSHSCRSVKGSGTPQYPPALSSFVALSSPAGTEGGKFADLMGNFGRWRNSDEGRGGKDVVSTGNIGWWPDTYN